MKKTSERNRKLALRYYNPTLPGSFIGSWKSFARSLGHKATTREKNRLLQWLGQQESYLLHKPIIRQHRRRRVIALGVGHIYGLDLIDVSHLKRWNSGMKFILVAIDFFSKKIDLKAIKNKTSPVVAEGFDFILKKGATWGNTGSLLPQTVSVDAGGEFRGAFLKYLKDNNIRIYVAKNPDTKVSIVERVIRTIRQKMYRYFTHKNTLRYIEVLPRIVSSYNATYHSSLKMSPNQVTYENQAEVRENLYGTRSVSESFLNPKQLATNKRLRASQREYDIGTYVHISKYKNIFRHGYTPNFVREKFRIVNKSRADRNKGGDRILYTIIDQSGEPIEGRFYAEELTPTAKGR